MSNPILETGPSDPRQKKISPGLKFALEMGPLLIFFLATFKGHWLAAIFPALGALGKPLFIATALFMAATAVSLVVSWLLTRSIPMMPLVSGVVVLIFGGLSIWLQNDTFIKMKPTIVYALFAAILLGGLAFNRPLLGYVFDQAFQLDDDGWRKLTFRWGLFFVVCAILNEVVWRSLGAFYPPDIADEYWAAFKLFGFTALTFIFVFSQMPLIMRHSLDQQVRK
ncbi:MULTISPECIES: septation protein A [Mesorhizobium]|uniref:Inner membrane-spanning protein YciB n=1 Tax=Mesorhizobium denitrificans TaxID=2294114 RepID=A0A371XGS0_9HYPH|nr:MULTISPECIES: septation protein A [Mesorhizobium]RFC68408.1 septation protein A [Mesorhizobium denitrificans]